MSYITGIKAEIEAVQADVDKLMGCPCKGVHVGGGRHAVIPDEFATGAPGWTEHHTGIKKHPTRDDYAIELDGEVATALADPEKRKRLAATKLAALEAKHATAKALSADWNPEVDNG